MNSLHPDNFRKVHVFITSHASINDSLKTMANIYGKPSKSKNNCTKIIIHIPYPIKELAPLVKEFMGDSPYQMYVEGRGKKGCAVLFTDDGNYTVLIGYFKNYLGISVSGDYRNRGTIVKFPKYPYNPIEEDNQGIFSNAAERLNPIQFKDKLVEAFKKNCPPSLMKSFKGDDDIFDYIVEQGEWSVK